MLKKRCLTKVPKALNADAGKIQNGNADQEMCVLSKWEKDLMLDLQAFVNHNKRLPRSSDNRNLYKRMRQFVARINKAYDKKKTREEIVEEYLGIKLSNVSNIKMPMLTRRMKMQVYL